MAALAVCLLMPACGAAIDENAVAAFVEPAVEDRAREISGKPSGDICARDLAGIRGLDLPESGISALGDLAYFTGLTHLNLDGNNTGDLSPLK
jgi:hypothetical protein